MAADIYLRLMYGDEEDQRAYTERRKSDEEKGWNTADDDEMEKLRQVVFNSGRAESVWVGEVPWLGADTHDGPGAASPYPAPVLAITQLFADSPVVDSEIIVSAHRAMNEENTTSYATNTPDLVTRWLGYYSDERVAWDRV